MLQVSVAIRGCQLSLFEASPEESVANAQDAEEQAHRRPVANDPPQDPPDEARIHGMAQLREYPLRHEVIDVLQSPELEKARDR